MSLEIQIHTLLFSFFFGVCFSLLVTINYKLIYHTKKGYQIICTFLIVIGSILAYFIGIRKVNDGIFHPYAALMIIVGFCLEHCVHTFLIQKIAFFKKK